MTRPTSDRPATFEVAKRRLHPFAEAEVLVLIALPGRRVLATFAPDVTAAEADLIARRLTERPAA